ncbi:MAG: hypothetical protein Q8Q01_05390 [archaeon]|nr:hypothetical protein [archaeon]
MGIQKGFQHAWKAVRKHKILFISLFILQIIYFIVAASVLLHYQVKILENVEGVTTPLGQANYDENALQEGNPFLADSGQVYSQYLSLKTNITWLGWSEFLLFIIFNGLLWIGSHHLLKKQTIKDSINQCGRFALSSGLFVVFFALISTFLIKTFYWVEVSQGSFSQSGDALGILFFVLYFFLSCSFAVLPGSWKGFSKRFFNASFGNFFRNVGVFVLFTAIYISLLIAIFYLTEDSAMFSYALLIVLLIMLLMTFLRLVWISIVQHYEKDHN